MLLYAKTQASLVVISAYRASVEFTDSSQIAVGIRTSQAHALLLFAAETRSVYRSRVLK